MPGHMGEESERIETSAIESRVTVRQAYQTPGTHGEYIARFYDQTESIDRREESGEGRRRKRGAKCGQT